MGARWLVLAFAVVLAAGVAHADDKPWAKGVTAEHQKAALALYNKGNAAFEQAEYKDALATYVEALALWDHPAIRYNAAVCRINLDRTLEAFDDLELALRFGEAPLGPDLYKQGLNYQKLLAKQVAELEIVVDDPPGASVSLDGKALFTAPGTKKQRVLAGDHQIVVEKPRYQTETKPVHVGGGDSERVELAIKPLAAARTLHRRMPRWIPYAVLTAGVAASGIGGYYYAKGRGAWTDYDKSVTNDVATTPLGVQPMDSQQTRDLYDKASRLQTEAYTRLAIGGAVLATGVVLIVLNQPRLGPVTPVVGSDHAGLALSGRW